MLSLTPWTDPGAEHSICQIYSGTKALSAVEIISALNINNISRFCFDYYGISLPTYRPYHYNPRLYMNSLNTLAFHWNTDTESSASKPLSWPESLTKNTTLL